MSHSVTVQQPPRTLSRAQPSTTAFDRPETDRRMHNQKRKHPDTSRERYADAPKKHLHGGEKQSWNHNGRGRGGSPAVAGALTPRSGRQFTVGNVGNNGMIYLRPVTRPTQQTTSLLSPTFLLPATHAADSRYERRRTSSHEWPESSYWGSRTSQASIPEHSDADHVQRLERARWSPPRRRVDNVRAHSFSTVDEHTRVERTEPGTFKIVISRPSPKRPRTADAYSMPSMVVSTGRARPSLADSASSPPAAQTSPHHGPHGAPGRTFLEMSPRTTGSIAEIQAMALAAQGADGRHRNQQYRRPVSQETEFRHPPSRIVIEPSLFDALAELPDDPSVVHYSPSTGAIIAATPARLIAHITSPSFLDYELLSHFFLTFRAYLTTYDLLSYLIARLQWSLSRPDDFGRIARVRTFVALRHWILNYFVDDFLPDGDLRVQFANLVNSIGDNLRRRADGGGGDLKIVGELKKCWRRTCALYWDVPDPYGPASIKDHIFPGGWTGSTESLNEQETQPAVEGSTLYNSQALSHPHFQDPGAISGRSQNIEWVNMASHVPQQSVASPTHSYIPDDNTKARVSEQSLQAKSCSFPLRTITRPDKSSGIPLFPQSATSAQTPLVAKDLSAPRTAQPSYTNTRSGSFSDALRDERNSLSVLGPRQREDGAPTPEHLTFAGSLVRGAQFPPIPPYFNAVAPSSPVDERIKFDLDQSDSDDTLAGLTKASYLQPPGVKKFFGNVRKVLGSRQSRSQPSYDDMAAPSPNLRKSSDTVMMAGGRSQKLAQKRSRSRLQIPLRIDILAAGVHESYRNLIKEQQILEEQGRGNRPSYVADTVTSPSMDLPPQTAAHAHRYTSASLASDVKRGDSSGAIEGTARHVSASSVPGIAPTTSLDTFVSNSPFVFPSSQSGHPEELHGPFRHYTPYVAGLHGYNNESRRSTMEEEPSLSVARQISVAAKRHSATSYPRQRSLRRYASYQSGMSRNTATRAEAGDSAEPELSSHAAEPDQHPTHQLRRRPGGNLRAVDNVTDLQPLKRSRSTGSVSNFAHSITNSMVYSAATSTPRNAETGAPPSPREVAVMREAPAKKISLVATHSSQPNLRASFQAEVSKLAALPDDDDDGGTEATLLKLEGRYAKPAKQTHPRPPSAQQARWQGMAETHAQHHAHWHNHPEAREEQFHEIPAYPAYQVPPEPQLSQQHHMPPRSTHQYIDESGIVRRTVLRASAVALENSYSSVERDLSDHGTRSIERIHPRPGAPTSQRPIDMQNATGANPPLPLTRHIGTRPLMEYVPFTEYPRDGAIGPGEPAQQPRRVQDSFLADGDDLVSDASSELSNDTAREQFQHVMQSFYNDGGDGSFNARDLLPKPTEQTSSAYVTGQTKMYPEFPASQSVAIKHDPQYLQRGSGNVFPLERPSDATTADRDASARNGVNQTASQTAHLPFILAYDSETLAEQFTIIEKDALDEIDWKDLIELRWKQSSAPVRDWVEYLKQRDIRGVDIASTRFNLIAKWAVSECVLTSHIDERVRCIIKYIHVAAHARRLRNYATMFQITMALSSSDCSRLSRTWALVPAADVQTMRTLETLIQPMRNFHNLRVEMDKVTGEDGCIPFIGIFTHDLIYNAQKPALIYPAAAGAGNNAEPLVNFERHHTAASIVKSLLRLLEASANYKFRPDPEVLSRCLWMAALPDEEITRLSNALE